MKMNIVLKSMTGFGFAMAALFAGSITANDEFVAQCEAYAEANGSSIDCTCLDEAAQADPSLYDEFAKVAKPEDAENLSEAAKAVVASCSAE